MDLQEKLKGMDQCLSHRRKQLYRQLLTNACKGLTFSQDVMWEMGPDNIPYSKADFTWLFCASGPLAPSTRSKSRKQGGTKVLPHHTRLRGSATPPLPALPPLQTVHHHSLTTNETFITVPGHQNGTLDSVKRIGLSEALNIYSAIPYQFPTILKEEEQSSTSKGDESVLKKLTKNTAQWIISQQIPRDDQYKARMQSQLKDQNGSASATDLATDESKVKEDFYGFYRAPESSPEPRALQSSKPETPLPVYYRIKGYSVSPVCTDEQGGINRTANDVTINHMETPKLPCLQDSLNPRAGKYVYDTENNFELELYTGIAKQVHQPGRKNQDRIIMDNNSEYQKNLQDVFPCGPERWTDLPSAGLLSVTKEVSRPEKGVRRWVGLPAKADYATELGLRPPDYNRQDKKVPKEPNRYSPMPGLSSLRYAVEGWRNAWKIKTIWQSVTIEGLKKDLTDLHCQVRVAAIATCASAAVNRPEVGPDPDETDQNDQSCEVEAVPPELQPLLLFALSDPVKRVQLAAAVCQYAIGTPNAHARDILRKALQHDSSGTGVDGWVAAQCLAIEGEVNQTVIERLLSQLFLSSAPSDQEQAATLLASVSSKTILVRSLLGEELNSADWRNRILACKTISELKCPINKDLTNKLLYLMWNDWSGLVRQAAAQALGKLGLGSDIHNELSVKLHEGPTPWRVEALVLIGQLKIMTAKLLPSFLRCLNDESVVVRKQACSTAASLLIKDEMIQNQLFQLMQNDSSCDVKVAAINALGRIGWLTPMLQGLLLWALQYEEEPSVRIAVCEALKMLGVEGPDLQNLLQERIVLEANAQVHRHIEDLMKHYGYSLDRDKGTVDMITEQVQKLCTKSNIVEKLLLLEDLKLQPQEKMPRKESQPEPVVISAQLQERLRDTHSSVKN
ncbi:HEAT repeat-containing protein 4 [Pangasianodon hypophthalmus]|uniref:HEAT repeat-containing protein 4 n=1 Tax=Pangasianodon hypophthalmus TaxID=310915 RepID=UPI002307E7CC|nr:HEAT repeat-containing protein 4 [Pangasianodon hypophthalmus]XP_053093598.1 HEAT repeat-containing protein 4 [Pangasianodon hypophthalmus]